MSNFQFLDAEFVSERYGEVHFRPIKMRYVFQIMIMEPPWFQLESYDYIMLGDSMWYHTITTLSSFDTFNNTSVDHSAPTGV